MSRKLTKVDMKVLDGMRASGKPEPWTMSQVADTCGIGLSSVQAVIRRGNVLRVGGRYGNSLCLYLVDELQGVGATC